MFYMYQGRLSLLLGSSRISTQRARQRVFLFLCAHSLPWKLSIPLWWEILNWFPNGVSFQTLSLLYLLQLHIFLVSECTMQGLFFGPRDLFFYPGMKRYPITEEFLKGHLGTNFFTFDCGIIWAFLSIYDKVFELLPSTNRFKNIKKGYCRS